MARHEEDWEENYLRKKSAWRGQTYGYEQEEQEEEPQMSVAMWCDTGQHAYSANDENAMHFSQTKRVPGSRDARGNGYDYREITVALDICGVCYAKQNPFQTANEKDTPALTGTVVDETPEERQNEDFLRGYREGILKGETAT